MFNPFANDNYNPPIGMIGRVPVNVTLLLIIIHSSALVLTCLLIAVGAHAILGYLVLSTADIFQSFQIWRVITYAFVDMPQNAGDIVWFAVMMLMLYWFGTPVEQYIGRRAYMQLYSFLVLVPASFTLLAYPFHWEPFWGSGVVHLTIFVAFALIYPRAEFMFGVQARWIALILIGAHALWSLAFHQWTLFFMLLVSQATLFAFFYYLGINSCISMLENAKQSFATKPLASEKLHDKHIQTFKVEPTNIHESIDPVLEKISKHGIKSLTEKERAALENARSILLKCEKKP